MKRFTRKALLALAIASPVPALARGGAVDAEPPRGPGGTNCTMNAEGKMGGGTMPMMMACASMMEGTSGSGAMPGGMGGAMGRGSVMHDGTRGPPEGAKVDAATAEAVALAYLHGRNPERAPGTEILDAALDAGRYVVTYRLGGTDGAVPVDAVTGTVVPGNR